MGNVHERETLKQIFPSTKWAKKVDAMSDSRVFAIYMRLKNQRKESSKDEA